MKSVCILLLWVLLLVPRGWVMAAMPPMQPSDEKTATLRLNGSEVVIHFPQTWGISENTGSLVNIESAPVYIAGGDDRALLRAELAAPEGFFYGTLPDTNRPEALLDALSAVLLQSGDAAERPDGVSEVVSFRWGDYPAALFLSYRRGGFLPDGGVDPARFTQWLVADIAPEVLLVLQFTAISAPDSLPTPETLASFASLRARVMIEGETLSPASVEAAFGRVANPAEAVRPVVAAVRLRNGVEARLAAPPEWRRQDITREADFPANILFQQDSATIDEGQPLEGALVQVSLMSAAVLSEGLGGELPPPGERLTAYLTSLSSPVLLGQPQSFTWGGYPAVLLTATYPPGQAAHSGGTYQHFIALEVDGQLLLLSLYAPVSAWEQIAPVWANMLTGLTVNGVVLPSEGVLAVLENAVFPEIE